MSEAERKWTNFKEIGILVTLVSYLVAGVWGAASFQQWVKSEFEVSRQQDKKLSAKIEKITNENGRDKIPERVSVLESRYSTLTQTTRRIDRKTDRILEYLINMTPPKSSPALEKNSHDGEDVE